jgi:thiamine biosynthesis lipoprotein
VNPVCRRSTVRVPLLLTAMALLSGACTRQPQVAHESFLAMSSYVELTVVLDAGGDFPAALQAVRDEVRRLESVLSDYDPESNVGRLNRRATTRLAPETRQLLERAQQVCHETAGAFDVSMRPIKHLWGFGEDADPAVPAQQDIDRLLRHVGCDVYRIDTDSQLTWNDAEAAIDLGGIAQGLVAQRVAEVLRQHGFARFLINISGDIVVGGTRPDGRAWRIGVQHPRDPQDLLARLSLQHPALTTSGDYEQAFFVGDRRYHHIFDPATGAPARRSVSVSVFCDDPIDADCYATAVFVMGPEHGLRFLEAKPGFEGLITWQDDSGTLHVEQTSGLHAEILLEE